jgi:hypothetical protein
MDCFELGIEETHRYFQNSHLPTENDEYLSPNYLRDRLYSFGVFSGIVANLLTEFVLILRGECFFNYIFYISYW